MRLPTQYYKLELIWSRVGPVGPWPRFHTITAVKITVPCRASPFSSQVSADLGSASTCCKKKKKKYIYIYIRKENDTKIQKTEKWKN